MTDVKIGILSKDSNIGAMVKAISFEISGPSSVKGATTKFLNEHGFLTFHFPDENSAEQFRRAIVRYLPGLIAHEHE